MNFRISKNKFRTNLMTYPFETRCAQMLMPMQTAILITYAYN